MSIEINKSKKIAPEKKAAAPNAFWAFMNKDISLGGSAFGAKKKVAFYEELEVLLTAGLDIRTAMELMVENLPKKKDKARIEGIMKQIVAGSSLSESMRQTTLFSEYEIFSVEIGEESGKLNEVLLNLSDFFQKTIRYRRQLTSALAYPLFVLGFSFFALWFLLRYLVPMFSGVYARFGSELPSLTRWVVSLSDGIRIYGPYFFILVAAGGFFLFTQRKQLWWRRFFASFLLRLPIFGGIIHKLFLARFCQSMSLLLGARVPLLQAVELIKQMIDFYPIEKALEQTHRNIIQGESLHKSLAAFPFFPAAFIALARVGEESGKLDIMFERLAKTYNADVDQRTQVIGSLIEPILIVFLGLIVALILVAMYLPLFKLSMNMGG